MTPGDRDIVTFVSPPFSLSNPSVSSLGAKGNAKVNGRDVVIERGLWMQKFMEGKKAKSSKAKSSFLAF
jgi:hypothetical protein